MRPDLTLEDKASNLKHGQPIPVLFPEYETIEKNERIVTIEFCSNCDDHQMHTSHSAESYINLAKSLMKAINLRFPSIKVILKPISTEIIKEKPNKIENSKIERIKPIRIGAFEVQICVKPQEVVVIHSKLLTNYWPNVNKVLNEISKFTPLIAFSIQLFNQNDTIEMANNAGMDESTERLLKSNKLSNIKVQVSRLNIAELNEVEENFKEDIQLLNDPKGRIKLLSTINFMKSSSTMNSEPRPFTPSFYSAYSDLNAKHFSNRIDSSRTKLQQAGAEGINKRWSSRTGISSRLNSSTTRSIKNENAVLENSNVIFSMRGDPIRDTFTDENGKVIFKDLPYDSYLIEVLENKHYSPVALVYNSRYLVESGTHIQKCLQLRQQSKSYATILVNEMVKVHEDSSGKEVYEAKLVSGADVFINKCDNDYLSKDTDSQETRIQLAEKAGKYEIVLVPGRYLVEIKKNGYNQFFREFELSSGENNINAELELTKKMNFKVSIFNFEKFQPLSNVLLKLKYSSSQEALEGISNKDGVFFFSNIKSDDFYTVTATCPGFFDNQRTYVRRNEVNTGLLEVTILMVRQEFIIYNNSTVLITYCNIPGENLETDFSFTDSISKCLNIDQFDIAKQGISSNLIKLRNNFKYKLIDLNYDPEEDDKEFGEVIRISIKIKNEDLLKLYEINKKTTLNGLSKYSCECTIFTPNGAFYVHPPEYSRDPYNSVWDLGFLDVRNSLFYELGNLTSSVLERTYLFNQWITFIQNIINEKAFNSIFQVFGFNDSILNYNDRLLHEPQFHKHLKNFLYKCSATKEKEVNVSASQSKTQFGSYEEELSIDFITYLIDLFKTSKNMISFNILKQKLASNLKNFKDLKMTSTFGKN